jgi:hypothetical protein
MGSQKVPGIVVLHCNCRTRYKAYLNIFKVRAMRTSTLTPSRLSLLEAPAEGFFVLFRSSAVAFHLMPFIVVKRDPLRPIFRVRNSQKSLGARSGGCGGWVMTGIAAQQAMCGLVRHRDTETSVPACHLSRRFLTTVSRNLCKIFARISDQ